MDKVWLNGPQQGVKMIQTGKFKWTTSMSEKRKLGRSYLRYNYSVDQESRRLIEISSWWTSMQVGLFGVLYYGRYRINLYIYVNIEWIFK